jgi:hypothetical protein
MTSDPIEITEAERPVRFGRPSNPQREIWQLMRAHATARSADREQARERVAAEHRRLTALLVDAGNTAHKLVRFLRANGEALRAAGLEEQVEVLTAFHAKLGEAIARAGGRVLDPVGEPYALDMSAWLDVVASVPEADVQRPLVRDTVAPGLALGDELLQRAQIVLAVPGREDDRTARVPVER